jgi:hypothetical protein
MNSPLKLTLFRFDVKHRKNIVLPIDIFVIQKNGIDLFPDCILFISLIEI